MERKDIILIFAKTINDDGTLKDDVRLRVDRGLEEFKNGLAPFLLMSGFSDWPDNQKTNWSQAEAMKRYALESGVPEDAVLIEEYSKDTKGSIFFSKVGILKPNGLKKVKMLTSDYHLPRVVDITRFMLPPSEFEVDFEGVATSDSESKNLEFLARERTRVNDFFEEMKERGIKPYDDEKLAKWFLTEHSAYKDDERLKIWLSQYVPIN